MTSKHISGAFSRDVLRPNELIVVTGGMLILLACLDILLPRVTISILYAIPLLLLAKAGYVRPLWRSALVFVLLTYGLYFAKYTIWPPETGAAYFDYRLVNRTFVAVMIWFLAVFMEMWREAQDLAGARSVDELFDPLDSEIQSTLALVLGVPLILLIAVVDFFMPGHLNVAVLYPLPQLACALAGNRRLLWTATALLVVLVFAGYWLGPASEGAPETFVRINRVLSAIVLLSLAVLLHLWTRPARELSSE